MERILYVFKIFTLIHVDLNALLKAYCNSYMIETAAHTHTHTEIGHFANANLPRRARAYLKFVYDRDHIQRTRSLYMIEMIYREHDACAKET